MVGAALASAWLLRGVLMRPGRVPLVVGGVSCALLASVLYSSAILILEGIHGDSSPSGIAMGGFMGLYYGPVLFGLSAHVSVPAGILGAAVLRYAGQPETAADETTRHAARC
jgi:hypothetical protein